MQKIVIKNGLICAFFGILITIILYLTKLDVGGKLWIKVVIDIVLFIIVILIGIKAVRDFKAYNGGKIDFIQTFMTTFFTFAIFIFISTFYYFIQNVYKKNLGS